MDWPIKWRSVSVSDRDIRVRQNVIERSKRFQTFLESSRMFQNCLESIECLKMFQNGLTNWAVACVGEWHRSASDTDDVRVRQNVPEFSRMFQTFSRKFHNVPEYYRMYGKHISTVSERVPESSRMFWKCSGTVNCRCYVLELLPTLNSTRAKAGNAASVQIICINSMWIGISVSLSHRFYSSFFKEVITWIWLPHRWSFVDTSNLQNLMSR